MAKKKTIRTIPQQRTPMREQDPAIRATNFEEVACGYGLEDALVEALEKGNLGGAQLDVFQTEPLPDNDRLFKVPNLVVSPHAAGGRPQGSEELIVGNLRRFLAGQDLKNAL